MRHLLCLLGLDQYKPLLPVDETDIAEQQHQISPARRVDDTTAAERVSFSLKKEMIEYEKDEIVYSSASNIM